MNRCPWPKNDELYIKYHDEEWGEYTGDDRKHFEFLILESAQAGLSWLTVLKKRENYRKAYSNFDPNCVAEYKEDKVEELMGNSGIIRNRRKISASVSNAAVFLEIQKEFGSYNNYLLSFTSGKKIKNYIDKVENAPATNAISDRLSLDMKRRGFKFLGSTIMYAHLQAVGIINDHLTSCFRFKEINKEKEILGGVYGDNLILYNAELCCGEKHKLLAVDKETGEKVGEVSIKDNDYNIKVKNIKGRNEYKEEISLMIEKYLI